MPNLYNNGLCPRQTLWTCQKSCICGFRSSDANGSLRHYSTVPYFVLHHGFKYTERWTLCHAVKPFRDTSEWAGLVKCFFVFLRLILKSTVSLVFCYSANNLCLITLMTVIWNNMAFRAWFTKSGAKVQVLLKISTFYFT